MNKLSINIKLIILIISSLLLLSITILTISVSESIKHSKQDKLAQLNSITASKKQHVESYFNNLGAMLVSIANSSTTGDALYYLGIKRTTRSYFTSKQCGHAIRSTKPKECSHRSKYK